jgi:hypothetical protein
MALDFIPPTIEGYNMITMTKVEEKIEWTLTPKDRCDRCTAEALVQVTGINGDLLFCGHHYNKIMENVVGYEKMMKFAITITDERSKLI